MSRSQWIQSGGSHNQTLNFELHPSLIMLFVLIPCNHLKSSCEWCLSLYKYEWKRPTLHQHGSAVSAVRLRCCEDLGCHSCICRGQPLPVAGARGVLTAVWPTSYGHGRSACTTHQKTLLSHGVLKGLHIADSVDFRVNHVIVSNTYCSCSDVLGTHSPGIQVFKAKLRWAGKSDLPPNDINPMP